MLLHLHRLSAVLFYLLGLSFFAAYVFLQNNFHPLASAVWMQVADLPFIAVALLYGGLSLYLSVRGGSESKMLPWLIGLPLALVFIVLVMFNFWIS